MKTYLALAVFLLTTAVALATGAQQGPNPIHPTFVPVGADGKSVTRTDDVAADKTCGACHDANDIASHSSHHAGGHAKATCIQCHLEGGRLEITPERLDEAGRLRRDALRIGSPHPSHCAACHGLVSDGTSSVILPPALATQALGGLTLTQGEGAVVAPQRMADSFMNLEGKASLDVPWDVHAAKLVGCAACHTTANNPSRFDDKQQHLGYVTVDPRRPSVAEFLARPDHRLTESSCRSCHGTAAGHGFLPYRDRHLEVLACATCHIPTPMGPALAMVDGTVATLERGPRLVYRNLERLPGEALNASMLHPFKPLVVERIEADGVTRLAPVNVVSRFRWVSGPTRQEVPIEKVVLAFLDGDRYAAQVLAGLDTNHDGSLDGSELRLDTPEKVHLIASRLEAVGVASPAILGKLSVHPLAHGMPPRRLALRDCQACHSEGSRLSAPFPLTPYTPAGVTLSLTDDSRIPLPGRLVSTPNGAVHFERAGTRGHLYVLGRSRHALSNTIGFFLFMAVFVGVVGHGAARLVLRRRLGTPTPGATRTEYVFGRYERLWHWTMALSGLVLIVTGFDIHTAGGALFLPLAATVAAHNAAAVLLTVNAGLSLFYHVVTVAIANFIPDPKGLWKGILEHLRYQSQGIFYGTAAPAHSAGQKLNPLQQLTYLALLNVLFPVQIVTGTLLWAVGEWPSVAAAVGGLSVVAPVHNVGAWLFLTFFVLHVYLVTTGRTLGDHLSAMLTGYQTVDAHDPTT